MNFRTDLAIELIEAEKSDKQGVNKQKYIKNGAVVNLIEILDEQAAKAMSKQTGRYITVETGSLSDDVEDMAAYEEVVCDLFKDMLPPKGLVLVAGLGNVNVTPDSLGPKVAEKILVTRHIPDEIKKSIGLETLRPVASVAPGVLGKTGIETAEIIKAVVSAIGPAAVLIVDSLAAMSAERLGRTIQMSDTGLAPGGGVGNKRCEITPESIGAKVFSVGVPTVADLTKLIGRTKLKTSQPLIVTPQEIDLVIERGSKLLSHAINKALLPELTDEELRFLVS